MARAKTSDIDSELYGKLWISRLELGLMTRQLSVLLGSGLEFRQSLDTLASGATNEDLKAVLSRTLQCIEAGWMVSRALKQFPRIFNQVYVSMVEVGEETGSLPHCLQGLANWLDSEEQLMRDVKSALFYPITVLAVACALTIFFLTVIFPGFADSLSMGGNIPFPTRVLMFASSALLNPLFWLLGAGAVFFFLRTIRAYLVQGDNRGRVFSFILYAPVLGPVLRDVTSSRFCAAFGILQSNGVDILKSFKLACLASGSPQAGKHIREGTDELIAGGRLSDYLKRHPEAFSRIMVDLIAVGEEAANLPETCLRLQRLLEADARYSMEILTGLLEPVLMVVISILVGTLIICTAMPMYGHADVRPVDE